MKEYCQINESKDNSHLVFIKFEYRKDHTIYIRFYTETHEDSLIYRNDNDYSTFKLFASKPPFDELEGERAFLDFLHYIIMQLEQEIKT